MSIKTAKSLVSSLRGSAFRRVTCDHRTWAVTQVRTLRSLALQGRHAISPRAAIERVRSGRP